MLYFLVFEFKLYLLERLSHSSALISGQSSLWEVSGSHTKLAETLVVVGECLSQSIVLEMGNFLKFLSRKHEKSTSK